MNSLTYSTQRRDKLISLRTGFAYISNILVLGFSLLVFSYIRVEQVQQFRILASVTLGFAAFTGINFIFMIREPWLSHEAKRLQTEFIQS